MHSSRMCTASGSSHPREVGLPQCMLGYTTLCPSPSVDLETPPPRCGLGTPQVWAWRPPWPDNSTSPLGVGLETPQRPARHAGIPPARHAGIPSPPWRPAARHAGISPAIHAGIPPPCPPVSRMTDRCKNITLP